MRNDWKYAGVIGIVFFIVLFLLFPIPTPYDHYTRLSNAFLGGKLCLSESFPWLNELIHIPALGYCVVYPITPALVSLPFVLLNPGFSQTTISHLNFASAGAIVYLLFRRKKWRKIHAFTMSLAWNFGTIFFGLSAVGSAWYIAQTIAATFFLLSLLIFDPRSRTRIVVAGFVLGLAATARLPLHLCIAYFIVQLWKNGATKNEKFLAITIFIVGFLPPFLLQRGYNFARYATYADSGYYLISGKFAEADFRNGQFHPANIPKHLRVLFLSLPKHTDSFPYIVPSRYGLSVFITSPFLLFSLLHLIRAKKNPELFTIFLVLGLETMHGTVGFTQFGYRFALDIYPLLFLGFDQKLLAGGRKSLLFFALLGLAILVNLWGVLSLRNDWFVW